MKTQKTKNKKWNELNAQKMLVLKGGGHSSVLPPLPKDNEPDQ